MVLAVVLPVFTAASAGAQLIEAVTQDDRSRVGTLLEAGVDVNDPEADGTTALAWPRIWTRSTRRAGSSPRVPWSMRPTTTA